MTDAGIGPESAVGVPTVRSAGVWPWVIGAVAGLGTFLVLGLVRQRRRPAGDWTVTS